MRLMLQDWFEKSRTLWDGDKEDFFLFAPVFLGAGIAAYFSLSAEPSLLVLFGGLAFSAGIIFYFRSNFPLIWFALAFGLFTAGATLTAVRTFLVAAPVLERSYKATKITATIEQIERKGATKWRLIVRPLSIRGMKRQKYPVYIRLSARQKKAAQLSPGQVIAFKAALFKPSRPAMPSGYDFARRAFFQQIGAVGYIISHITIVPQAQETDDLVTRFFHNVEQVRQTITKRISAVLPDQEGAIASALLTGKRGQIEPELYEAIRHSGLAHLLAISGLHMAVMAGTLFWLVHMILALSASLSLSWPIRKWAVMFALVGATFYLFLSGAGIATQRAYIMLVVGFLAILFDRPALTLRNLALAALIILIFRPESVLEAGFQMSFATTAALISFYEYRQSRRDKNVKNLDQSWIWGHMTRFIGGIFLTSLIAGFAVIPFAAFHFHQIAVYSLAGNLLVMPVFVFIVMPMTLVTLILMPFGLEFIALKVMALGLSYIIAVAKYVASWDGAVISFSIFPLSFLIVMAGGGLVLMLLRSKIRYLGLVPLGFGLYAAVVYQDLDFIIDEKLEAIALHRHDQNKSRQELKKNGAADYLLLKRGRKKSSLEQWLGFSHRRFSKVSVQKLSDDRAQGQLSNASQQLDIQKDGDRVHCDAMACIFRFKQKQIALVTHRSALNEECHKSDILILAFPLRHRTRFCAKPEVIITKTDLRKKGAHALVFQDKRVEVLTVSQHTGQRPWAYKKQKWRPFNKKKSTPNINRHK